jgi:hypothetical protein
VPKIELGPIEAVINPDDGNAFVDMAVELEELGYSTIWPTRGPVGDLSQIADAVWATKRARVASGTISVDRFGADEVAALFTNLESTRPSEVTEMATWSAPDRGCAETAAATESASPQATVLVAVQRLRSDEPAGESGHAQALRCRVDEGRTRVASARHSGRRGTSR